MLLFNSLVRSRLEYCSELWDVTSIGLINEIEYIQRSFTKKINGLREQNYWMRLKILKIYSLQRRRERQTILYTWKIKNSLVRNDIGLAFESNARRSQQRAILKPLPKVKGYLLSAFEQSFSIRGAKLWNILPTDLKFETSKNCFISKLDKWLKLFPDEPPIQGHYHRSKNSLLDYNLNSL